MLSSTRHVGMSNKSGGLLDIAGVFDARRDTIDLYDQGGTRIVVIARDGFDRAYLVSVMSVDDDQDRFERDIRILTRDHSVSDRGRASLIERSEPCREVRLYIPRRLFDATVGRIDTQAGLRRERDDPLFDLFVVYLGNYATGLPTMSAMEAEIGLDSLLHLLKGLAANTNRDMADESERLAPRAIPELADEYIFVHLGDANLTPSKIARALGISRTRLYAAFADRGGVSAAIRDARLDGVRDRLSAASHRSHTIEDVAIGYGFDDYTSFHRAFRRRFGQTPRDIRAKADRSVTSAFCVDLTICDDRRRRAPDRLARISIAHRPCEGRSICP